MPIFGIGLHVIVAIFFAVHALRTGRQMYWLYILFIFPGLGSIVYFFAEYLPELRRHRGVKRATAGVVDLLDPSRDVRDARHAFDLAPSTQNQYRLAKALAERGETAEAMTHFDACLQGPFGRDANIRLEAAALKLKVGQVQQALELTTVLREEAPSTLLEKIMVLHAEALAASGERSAAQQELLAAKNRFGSFETKARYALLVAQANLVDEALKTLEELRQDAKHWNSHTRSTNSALFKEVERAVAALQRN